MLQVVAGIFLAVVLLALPIMMVRGVMQMWRDKDRSGSFTKGVAGALAEVDRTVRPSAQHVLEAKDSASIRQQDGIGGD